MSELEIIKIISEFTALPIIALLGVIIFYLVRNKNHINKLENNHLHILPELKDAFERMENKLDKISDNILIIQSKINKGR